MKGKPLRRLALLAAGLMGALVAILGISYAVVISVIDSDFLEGVFNDALTPATDGLYQVEVGAMDVSFLARSVELADLTLRVRQEALDHLQAVGATPPLRAQGTLNRVTLEGVDLIRLARDRDFVARAFRVEGPRFQLTMIPWVAESAPSGALGPVDPPAASAGSTGAQATEVPTDLEGAEGEADETPESGDAPMPRVEIAEISLTDVDVALAIESPSAAGAEDRSQSLANNLHGLSVHLRGLAVDPSAPMDRRGLASFADEAELAFESLRVSPPGGLHFAVDGLSVSTATETLGVERFAMTPDASVEEFLNGAGPPGDRIELAAGPISFEGMEFVHFLRTLEARIRRGAVQNLDLRVLSDHRRHQGAGPKGPQFMPHTFIQGLPIGIALDTLHVQSGSVVYTERGLKSDETGSVPFSDVNATLTNISNEPGRMTAEAPMVLEARLRGFESAPVAARIEMPLLQAPPTMHVQAWVGGFPAPEVNSILPNLEGLRVTDGQVDTAWVSIHYGPRRATGSVVALYGDARLQVEQAGSGEQNIFQKAASFAANTIAIRHDNRPDPGDSPRRGKVDYEILPEKPFFGVLWEALREGVLDLVIAL